MDSQLQIQEKLPADNLKKHLAVAVRSIHWSYSIFWSISSSDPSQLEWSEGYYNGDIKTRKTVQAVELDVDQLGLQRSEQLRELYESLLDGDTNPQAKRPSAALSPEDLSNTEWYYLVCMSFVFQLGQGLPGRTFQTVQPLWLCNAHQADSKVFNRSLLAKSASVQTIVCFPFLGGVVELGITDLIPEDFSLIQYVQASLMGIDCPILERPNLLIHQDNDIILETSLLPIVEGEDMRFLESPNNSSGGFGTIQPAEEIEFMIEGVNGNLIDDELCKSIYTSLTSSECISLAKTENVHEIHPQGHENPDGSCLLRIKSDTQHQWSDDLHYQNVLTSLSKSTHKSIMDPFVDTFKNSSCFLSWKKSSNGSYHNPRYGYMQRVLKKVLIEVPRMYKDSTCESKDNLCKELASNHVLVERKRREKVNDRFSALKSLIPSVNKADKVSILDETINHVTELKRRVEELEKFEDIVGYKGGRQSMNPQDMVERTSDNYRTNKTGIKRKSSDSNNEEKLENNILSLRDSSDKTNMSISLNQKEVLIEIKCPWKECLLLETIDALSNLRLDTHSVQSSTSDSFLSLTIKAKINGPGRLSAGLIRQVLLKVLMKSG